MFGSKYKTKQKDAVLVGLTSLGRQQAEQIDAGGAREQTLLILAESGPLSVAALRNKLESRNITIQPNQFILFLRSLKARGLIMPIGPNGEYPTP